MMTGQLANAATEKLPLVVIIDSADTEVERAACWQHLTSAGFDASTVAFGRALTAALRMRWFRMVDRPRADVGNHVAHASG